MEGTGSLVVVSSKEPETMGEGALSTLNQVWSKGQPLCQQILLLCPVHRTEHMLTAQRLPVARFECRLLPPLLRAARAPALPSVSCTRGN